MISTRRTFLNQLGILSLGVLGTSTHATARSPVGRDQELPAWSFPRISDSIKEPVIIERVELLKTQGKLLLAVTSADGLRGVTQCNDRMPNLTSLLKGLIIEHFMNQDARDLPTLVDNAYRLNSNYKYSGMPLWNCIGSVEIAVWDLLGRVAQKPVCTLLGTPLRNDYGIYISDWSREGDPEKITDQLLAKLADTGAKGVKIKIGGRMVNTPENTAQTKRYIPVLRRKLGDDVVIYADANGSYTPAEGIEAGRLLEDHGVEIFEEPCNFEDEVGTKKVNASLRKLRLAGGEQDTSLYRFRSLATNDVYDILQPDLYYNGGILRALHVSAIARAFGNKSVAPHTPKADPLIAPFWQVAALVPNLYGLQEFVYNPGQQAPSWHTPIRARNGRVTIPSTPGLGIDYDDGIWKSAVKIVDGES